MSERFSNQLALVAGGTGGLGRAVSVAFLEEGAYQCGYCIPGMIMNAVALLQAKPNPSDDEISTWMNRNLCRCCGYPKIVSAVRRAAGQPGK